ncbi:MAG TPA: hypothetical protein VH593_32395 [Ktedonobacteraceae bacterium]
MARTGVSADELAKAAERLSTNELRRLIDSLLSIQARRNVPSLSARESALVQTINRGLPADKYARYRELIRKRREETLTEAEYKELLDLTEQSEHMQVERLAALIELAQIRNMTLDDLMDDLGIKPPPVE